MPDSQHQRGCALYKEKDTGADSLAGNLSIPKHRRLVVTFSGPIFTLFFIPLSNWLYFFFILHTLQNNSDLTKQTFSYLKNKFCDYCIQKSSLVLLLLQIERKETNKLTRKYRKADRYSQNLEQKKILQQFRLIVVLIK